MNYFVIPGIKIRTEKNVEDIIREAVAKIYQQQTQIKKSVELERTSIIPPGIV